MICVASLDVCIMYQESADFFVAINNKYLNTCHINTTAMQYTIRPY